MAETQSTETAEAKAPRPKRVQGHPYDTKISYGADSEGKLYGADENNPKRGGAATRFKLYEQADTIQKALDAGMKPEDIGYDIKKGFIVAEKAA